MADVKAHNISSESLRIYRYYLLGNNTDSPDHEIKIHSPVTLYCGTGHAFHRVWDGLRVILCHSPGPIRNIDREVIGWCVISWVPQDVEKPVKF